MSRKIKTKLSISETELGGKRRSDLVVAQFEMRRCERLLPAPWYAREWRTKGRDDPCKKPQAVVGKIREFYKC
jgi:hypothetical protein